MIYLKNLEDEKYLASYRKDLENRGGNSDVLNRIIKLNQARKQQILDIETKKSKQKRQNHLIAEKKKNSESVNELIGELQILKEEIKELENTFEKTRVDLEKLLCQLPNKCHFSVPSGKDARDNRVERVFGKRPSFSFQPKVHHELVETMGIVDFERASKVTGSRFSFLLGWGAKLERALVNFMLDVHTKEFGYKEVIPPFLVNEKSLFGTGQFPKFKEDVFHVKDFPYYLIPTAEAPMTNYFRDEILKEDDPAPMFCCLQFLLSLRSGKLWKGYKGADSSASV